jgi:hypothetical protein
MQLQLFTSYRFWLAGLAMLLLGISGAQASSHAGKVIAFTGSAELFRGGQTLPISLGTAIQAQDIIQTANGGIVEIQFTDMSMVTVGSDSQLIIDRFVFDAKAPADDISGLRVGAGFFHFVSGKMAREKVRIDTPVSTIGIRGTALAGEVAADGKTIISLVECCVDARNESGATRLDRVGTFTEIRSRRYAPSQPALTPDWWADKATAALGKSHEELGLEAIASVVPEEATAPSAPPVAKPDASYELGPDNRRSFPYINR